MPRWAAALVSQLVRNAPPIVSVELVERLLTENGETLEPKVAVSRLIKYGWLRKTKVQGAYAFIPPGTDTIADPYVDLRGWSAAHPGARFSLAGVSAAWHLGYLYREPERPAVWFDSAINVPKRLRATLDIVTTGFPAYIDVRKLGPSSKILRSRRLDILDWAKGLPAFGPEALLVQISSRPAGFSGWVDLAGRLKEFAADVDLDRLAELLPAASAGTRQRIVYLLKLGGRRGTKKFLPKVLLPAKFGTKGPASWDATTGIIDHLLAPLIHANSKA